MLAIEVIGGTTKTSNLLLELWSEPIEEDFDNVEEAF